MKMMRVAEANPAASVVASYKIHGRTLECVGPEFPREVLSGGEVCRRFFQGELGLLGGPTNHLIRVPTASGAQALFDGDLLAADTELFIRLLKKDADYAFVHQVLTFTREHESTVSSTARTIGMGACDLLTILTRHGRDFLPEREFRAMVRSYRRAYARWLVRALLKFWDRRGWRYQASQRQRLNIKMQLPEMLEAAVREAVAAAVTPVSTLRKIALAYRRTSC
jgi:hypothetical protein